MNFDTAALEAALGGAGFLSVETREWFPYEAEAADPVPTPSNLRKSLLSTPTPSPGLAVTAPGASEALGAATPRNEGPRR